MWQHVQLSESIRPGATLACCRDLQLTWPHGADLVTKLWGSAEDLYRTTGFVASRSDLYGCRSLKKEKLQGPMKTSWLQWKDANWSGTGTSHDRVDWPGLSCREQFKKGDEEADRGNAGKTTSKSGLALTGIYYYGKPRTSRSGGSCGKIYSGAPTVNQTTR